MRSREAEMQGAEIFEKRKVKTYRDLNVYRQSFDLAMKIYHLAKEFPPEERFSMTDQIRRAARSIPANMAEGWAKRVHEKVFKRHLYDCIGSCEEIKVWLEFAKKCNYISAERIGQLQGEYAEVGAMLASLVDKWQTF